MFIKNLPNDDKVDEVVRKHFEPCGEIIDVSYKTSTCQLETLTKTDTLLVILYLLHLSHVVLNFIL